MRKKCKSIISSIIGGTLIFSIITNYLPVNVYAVQGLNNEGQTKLNEDNIGIYSMSSDENEEEEVRVIIQLNENAAIDDGYGNGYTYNDKVSERNLKDSQKDVINQTEQITGTTARKSFAYLINGFSINTKRKYIEELKNIDGVKEVSEVRGYKSDYDNEAVENINNIKSLLGSTKYNGEGMVVSIIDTGIDYKHKDLQNINCEKIKLTEGDIKSKINEIGHGEYFSNKIPYGYNYADENANVVDTVGTMHGMHVAGIVGANGDEDEVKEDKAIKAIKGIVPEVQLLDMKVFSNNSINSLAYDDDIIQAIEDSVKLGADVINMSFSTASGFSDPSDPENQAVKKATDAGVICVTSAGNKGPASGTVNSINLCNLLGLKDTGCVGSPSTCSLAFSVASMENSKIRYDVLNIDSKQGRQMKALYYNVDDSYKINGEYEVVDCGSGEESELAGKDLLGKVALIRKKSNNVQKQYDNISKYNPKAVIMYNDVSEGNNIAVISLNNVDKPVLNIANIFGESMKYLIEIGDNTYNLSLGAYIPDNPYANEMSFNSSWGSTSDLEFKPEVTAVGGEVYSLANNDSYKLMSGTSMASPNIAASEVMILQSLKEKGLELSGSDKVKFIKNTVMNTAIPLLDKKSTESLIPYSPRRQGAGAIQLQNAIKNNVTIEYKDGKAAAALKEVGNETSFQLVLTNYGEYDVMYKLQNEKVYGEEIDSEYLIHEKVLEGSTAKFDSDSVTVKAGESTTVNVILNISKNEEMDRFVEGYLNFKSIYEDVPSLSVPFMGFYGDWSKEEIVDIPNYNGIDSKVGTTGLVSKEHKYYGSYLKDGQQYIDKEKIAFSPNGDGVKDTIMPALYMLRNAKSLKIEILDSKGNVINNLYNAENVRRNVLSNGIDPMYLSEALWNGSIYNQKTGEFIMAEDGQYIVRIISKLELQGAKEQTLDIPVKIDTKAPEVNIEGIEKYTDESGNTHYELLWRAEDNEGGCGISDVYEVKVNGQTIESDLKKVTVKDDIYRMEIPCNDEKVNYVSVTVSDNAGNSSSSEGKKKIGELNNISASGLSDGMVIGKKDLINEKFIIKGFADDNIEKLVIDGENVEVIDNYFEKPIDVTEGKNIVEIHADDKNGKETFNKSYTVIADKTEPKVTIKQNVSDKQPYYTTYEDKLNLDILADDNMGCSIKFKNISSNNEIEVKLNSEKQGTAVVDLVNGLNKIEMTAEDEAGNKTIKNYLVMKGDSISKLSVSVDNVSAIQYFNKNNFNNGVYKVKGHVSKKDGILKINNKQIDINEDLTFLTDISLTEGENMVRVYAEDNDKKVIADYSYKIYYDDTAPQIAFEDLPIIRGDEKMYVDNPDFHLKGVLNENLFGCNLYINDERILNCMNYLYKLGECIEKKFEKNIKLNDGENIIKVYSIDSNGNVMSQNLNVVLDKEAPSKPKVNLSTNKLNNESVKVKITSDESDVDRIEYSTDNMNYVKYTGEFTVTNTCKIYARSVDYAGNISELENVDVNIDSTKTETNSNGDLNEETYSKPLISGDDIDDKGSKITLSQDSVVSDLINDTNNYNKDSQNNKKINLSKTSDSKINMLVILLMTLSVIILIVNIFYKKESIK